VNDRGRVYAAVLARSIATGMIGVLLGLHLAALELRPGTIGAVVTAGLAGATLATVLVTLRGDRLGRRLTLCALTVLSGLGALALALASHPVVLLAASFLGMVNGMGRDRGAALVIEQAALPATATDRERTLAFARYNVLQDVGHAAGGLLAGAPLLFGRLGLEGELSGFRASVLLYGLLSLAPLVAYARLSPAIELSPSPAGGGLAPESRRILGRICSLFALDGLGGGFLTAALVALFFHERFGVGAGALAPLYFGARVANALSHLGAAWLARRIGLVNTMVFTHIPSSLLLVTVACAPSFPVAAVLFLVREGLVEMDVPTRQSYVMAIVRAEERTLASGVTHLVRLAAWAVAPAFAGAFMERVSLVSPLVLGAALKLAYDLLLWRALRHVRPPEERGSNGALPGLGDGRLG
jgi:MFS family permease